MVPIGIMVSSAQLALASKIFDPHYRIYDMEAFKGGDKMQITSGYLTRNKSIEPMTKE